MEVLQFRGVYTPPNRSLLVQFLAEYAEKSTELMNQFNGLVKAVSEKYKRQVSVLGANPFTMAANASNEAR
jgi:hypothetical protein